MKKYGMDIGYGIVKRGRVCVRERWMKVMLKKMFEIRSGNPSLAYRMLSHRPTLPSQRERGREKDRHRHRNVIYMDRKRQRRKR